MTAMELKCQKMELVEELLSIDDKDTLNRVKNYLKKLNNSSTNSIFRHFSSIAVIQMLLSY